MRFPNQEKDETASDALPQLHQRLLVVEDHEDARTSLQEVLSIALKLSVDTAEDGEHALEMLMERPYSVVITDLRMPKVGGMKLIEGIQLRKIPVTVIVTTGHGSVHEAVQAIQKGAFDFLTKPVDPQHLCHLIRQALRERALQDEIMALRQRLEGKHSFQNVLGKTPRMLEIFELIRHIANTNSTVLICGETGTGKEMIARAIHQASAQHRAGAMVAINCAAVPETLLESELFGHEKGSFTGAIGQRRGRFEQAHQGTLFLDEIGDVPASMQIKLLRVLQERQFERVGSGETIEIDVRLIAATNKPLEELVKRKKFREDLFYRLNVIKIDLPPLRERPDDIPLLAVHFAQKFARPNQPPAEISADAMAQLLASPWPGNIRQLENAIEQASVISRDGIIRLEHLPPELSANAGKQTKLSVNLSRSLSEQLDELITAFEEHWLKEALKRTNGHIGRCAALSGLSRRSITEKISRYKIQKADFKGDHPS